jgi:hypothetical protein
MPGPLKVEFPSLGWRQFLTSRKELLDAFDSAREKAKSHEVETYHGKVAEAEFRKWLASFLPKKFGVTAGYIVSTGLKSTEKAPHFDVIIYEQLESPILWIEDNPDASQAGQSLAIPVEHVRAVLEVKSQFSPSTVDDAIGHLRDLSPLMGGIDDPNEYYKLHLPATFSCGVAFFDLRSEHLFSEAALNRTLSGLDLRGYFGGIILRGEGHSKPMTGRVSLLRSETPLECTVGRGKESLLGSPLGQSVRVAEKLHIGCMLMWAESGFSQFAFDLIALMQGKYRSGYLSSFYGMGASKVDDHW